MDKTKTSWRYVDVDNWKDGRSIPVRLATPREIQEIYLYGNGKNWQEIEQLLTTNLKEVSYSKLKNQSSLAVQ